MPLVSKTFSQIITFTRASSATYFDATGTLQTATTDAPRFDYDPSTLAALGFLIEESRTNGIRNNTMQGAAAGTPGTLPTNWAGVSPADNINREIVGTGIQNGIDYIDVKFSGTSGTAGSVFLVLFEANTQVVAANGQTWTSSVFVSVVGGTTNNISSLGIRQTFRDGTGASLQTNDASLLTATSSLNRFSVTATGANASIAFINPSIVANFADNSAIDITLRIGLPQLEQGAFATSVIPTTTTAVTRAADVASVNTLSPWYNAAAGTIYVEAQSPSAAATYYYYSLNNGTANEIRLASNSSGNNPTFVVTNSGVSQASIVSILTAGTAFKAAAAYESNSFNSAVNGVVGTRDTSGTPPTAVALQIGARSNSTLFVNGYIKRLTYYPRNFSDAELQSITT